jgi:hypothetical protein
VTVSGNGSRNPSTSFTPAAAGNYWWIASYSGDANNNASDSGCGTAMAKTVVYSVTSAATATDTSSFSNSTATSRFTISPSTTYLLLVYRHSTSADNITSISSSGFAPTLGTASFTSLASQSYNTVDYQWAYYVTTSASAAGTGTLTVNFAQRLGNGNQIAILNLIKLQGNSTTSPIVTANTSKTTGTAATATANLLSAPAAADAGLVFLSSQQGLGTAPAAAPAMTNIFYSQQTDGTMGLYAGVPAKQNESFSVGTGRNWGTVSFEVNHG